jgi:flavodoxin
MQRTLIVYESKYRTTEQIVKIFAKILGPAQYIKSDKFNKEYNDRDLVVIASPIYNEQLHQNIINFVSEQKDWLRDRKVALLSVALSKKSGLNALTPLKNLLEDCVIWSGTTKGRLAIDKLTEDDKKRLKRFYEKVGKPFQNRDELSLNDVVKKACCIKELRDKCIEVLPDEILLTEIEKFIKSHNTCALATGYGDKIRCTPIEYLYLTGIFYIISEGGEKFANITLNENVSLSIFDPYSGMDNLGGMQISGKAFVIEEGSEEYEKIFEYKGISIKKMNELRFSLNLIKIIPKKVEFISSNFKSKGYPTKQIFIFKKSKPAN